MRWGLSVRISVVVLQGASQSRKAFRLLHRHAAHLRRWLSGNDRGRPKGSYRSLEQWQG